MAYPPEQIQQLYKKLPKELQEAVFSEETAETIGNACEQYGIGDERVSQVAKCVGDVLMGFILPSEFEEALRKNVDLPEVLVKPIASEINRFVFFPVKKQLEQIHVVPGQATGGQPDIGIPTPRHSERIGVADQTAESTEEENGYMAEPSEKRQEQREEPGRRPDQYRETIE